MKKKARRFDEGGFLTKEGKNENISDDTRERARKFVEDREESEAPKATPKAAAKAESKPTPAPKAETKSESKPKAETADAKNLRLQMAAMTANVIKSGMQLLGIQVPSKM